MEENAKNPPKKFDTAFYTTHDDGTVETNPLIDPHPSPEGSGKPPSEPGDSVSFFDISEA